MKSPYEEEKGRERVKEVGCSWRRIQVKEWELVSVMDCRLGGVSDDNLQKLSKKRKKKSIYKQINN